MTQVVNIKIRKFLILIGIETILEIQIGRKNKSFMKLERDSKIHLLAHYPRVSENSKLNY